MLFEMQIFSRSLLCLTAMLVWVFGFSGACTPKVPRAGDSAAQSAQTYSGTNITFCSASSLDACIAGNGGEACVLKHCNKEIYEDNVCATQMFSACLAGNGGIGCKKFCGHPVQCLRKSSVFDCGPGGCQCFATGQAAESPIGEALIDLASGAGISFTGFLLKRAVLGLTKISASAVGGGTAKALAASLDDSFGQAFGMGARFGLRMTAHAHELTAQGAIKSAPSVLRIKIGSVRAAALPNLGANADNYIWIIDDAGHFIIAPEVKLAARETLGHPTLCGGCLGRIAGEVERLASPDGSLKLIINNQSGRYFNDPKNGKMHLENAARVLQILAGDKVEVIAKFLDF